MSRRLQVTLTDHQYEALLAESERSGLPMAELIRRSLDESERDGKVFRVAGYEFRFGVWNEEDAAKFRRRIRRGVVRFGALT